MAKRNATSKKDPNHPKVASILEAGIKVFGDKGYDNATISDICKEAKISDATLYKYFQSKEEVLFAIPARYNKRGYERVSEILGYIDDCREKMRFIVRFLIEAYEAEQQYTSVALLLLKTNRKFLETSGYEHYRLMTREIVTIYTEGVEKGVFRRDLSPFIVRNMVLGFIEHLIIQWLLVGRPEKPSQYIDMMNDMIIRSIQKDDSESGTTIKITMDVGSLTAKMEDIFGGRQKKQTKGSLAKRKP